MHFDDSKYIHNVFIKQQNCISFICD
uniref:Uncharacterized protein n=1 Tax=Heterorhabditis bacteriophora TaxID=37862 RepID=A0A1I7WNW5_HETBA